MELYKLLSMKKKQVKEIAKYVSEKVTGTKNIIELVKVVLKEKITNKEQFCFGFIVGRFVEKNEALSEAIYNMWGEKSGLRPRKSVKRIEKSKTNHK